MFGQNLKKTSKIQWQQKQKNQWRSQCLATIQFHHATNWHAIDIQAWASYQIIGVLCSVILFAMSLYWENNYKCCMLPWFYFPLLDSAYHLESFMHSICFCNIFFASERCPTFEPGHLLCFWGYLAERHKLLHTLSMLCHTHYCGVQVTSLNNFQGNQDDNKAPIYELERKQYSFQLPLICS